MLDVCPLEGPALVFMLARRVADFRTFQVIERLPGSNVDCTLMEHTGHLFLLGVG